MRRTRGVCRPVRPAATVVALALVVAVALVAPVPGGPSPAGAEEVRPIVFPVQGPVAYVDSFGAPRSGGRSHIGVDMMGEKLLPLVAAASGTVTWLRHDSRGNNLQITDDEGWTYHYVHINNDSPGTDDGANPLAWAFVGDLEVGDRVVAGQRVAYLGDSGNAEESGAQLHFEILRPDGAPINPTASVRAAEQAAAASAAAVPPGAVRPFADFPTFVDRLYTAYYGTQASAAQQSAIAAAVLSDPAGLAGVVAGALRDPRTDERLGRVLRLYESYFLRLPDAGGYRYWLDENARGLGLYPIAVYFAASPEFAQRYGTLTDPEFVELVYGNVLGRGSDEQGRRYWLDLLASGGIDRGGLMLAFSDSAELRARTVHRLEAVAVSWLVDGSVPAAAAVEGWAARRSAGETLTSVVASRLG